jgi:hypothetical protein
MARHRRKSDLPVSEIWRYLEPGPIVLVTSTHGNERNIMTMGWHTVMEFTPSLVGCVIAGGNHSFGLDPTQQGVSSTFRPRRSSMRWSVSATRPGRRSTSSRSSS